MLMRALCWLYCTIWTWTLAVLLWAMVAEGPALLDCLKAFMP